MKHTIVTEKGITKCAKAAICVPSFIQVASKLIPSFWPIFTDVRMKFFVQTLISQPNIDQIKRFMDQNLRWLIVNRKQFQFRKSKTLFSSYAPTASLFWLTRYTPTIDDYAKDGGPGEVWLLCSFYNESLRTWIKTIGNKFAVSNHTALISGVHALRSYLKLSYEYELHSLPNKNVSSVKDHGKNYIKVRPHLVRHLLRNRLFPSNYHDSHTLYLFIIPLLHSSLFLTLTYSTTPSYSSNTPTVLFWHPNIL